MGRTVGVRFLVGAGFFIVAATSRPTLEPTQWVLGVLSLRIKRSGRDAYHSPPSGATVKNSWTYTSSPPCAFTGWCIIKNRDNFTFCLYLYLMYYSGTADFHHIGILHLCTVTSIRSSWNDFIAQLEGTCLCMSQLAQVTISTH
jgi:hypothetical protein